MSEDNKKTIHIVPATNDTSIVGVSIDSDGALWLEEENGGFYGDQEAIVIPKDHLKDFVEALTKEISKNA